VVAAVIFAKLLHAENFTQRREDAEKFSTRIPRIITNSIFQSPSGWHLCSWTIKNGQSSVGAKSSGKGRMMPPRRGWGIFGLGFYEDVAPTALRKMDAILNAGNSLVVGYFGGARLLTSRLARTLAPPKKQSSPPPIH
jgi:hypothetical protein